MRRFLSVTVAIILTGMFLVPPVMAKGIISNQHEKYKINELKSVFDDPRPYMDNFAKLSGAENMKKFGHDVNKAKELWAEVVGFTTPEVVGKIAPEIKPGKYSLDDKSKYPFEKLMPKVIYDLYSEPGNFAGSFSEFEVVEPRQYFHHQGVAEATKANEGAAKLDNDGYLDYATLKPGYPFARPSGPQKADQIVYNSLIEYQHISENFAQIAAMTGFNKNLKRDFDGAGKYYQIKLANRSKLAPHGAWYDDRANKTGEQNAYYYEATEPRDLYGNAYVRIKYQDPKKNTNFLFYTTMTRRVRKISSSDMQDQSVGMDIAYDDVLSLDQKYRPDVFPYDVKILEETEILIPAYSLKGDEYVDTKAGMQRRNVKMQRRPVYVVEMKQLSSSYIYSKRIVYVDRETFVPLLNEMYDQKGRLWRSQQINWIFVPEVGNYNYWMNWQYDHLDTHTTLDRGFEWLPADMDRKQFSPKRLMRLVK